MSKEYSPRRFVRNATLGLFLAAEISACNATAPTPKPISFEPTLSLPVPTETTKPTPTTTPTLEPTPTPTLEPTFVSPRLPEQTPLLQYVYPGEFVKRGDPTKKVLYITIDDLWHADTVRQIIATLDEEGVNASFFPIGRAIDPENHSDQAQYIIDTYSMLVTHGNVIGNHTNNHAPIQPNTPSAAIDADLERQLAIVQKVTGNPNYMQTWMRPPGGQGGLGNKFPNLGAAAEAEGMGVLTWTISSGGDGGATTAQIIAHVITSFQNGAVILFHGYPNDANSLKTIIEAGKAQGYTFDTIDHLVPDPATSCTFDTATFPAVKSCG